MPFVDIGELRLHYQEVAPFDQEGPEGALKPGPRSGPPGRTPVVFMHGFTLDHRMWQQQAAFFGRTRRVICMDARGHGKSDAPTTGYSRPDRVEDLYRFVSALNLERFHLVGLSMGGTTGIGFALKHQERLASLTLVSSAAAGWDASNKVPLVDKVARERGLEAARQKWKDITLIFYRKDRQHIRDLMEQMVDDFSGATWMDPMRGRYQRDDDLPNVHQISVPTEILVGERDRIFVPLAEQLHERIAGSELHIYEKTGHMVNLEQPERFNGDLADFLNRVDDNG